MTSSLEAWFTTRPRSVPNCEPPNPKSPVMARARTEDGAVELRIIRRGDGTWTFEFEAWTSFVDAGGQAHDTWWTFEPSMATFADSPQRAVELALADSRERGLVLGAVEWLSPEAPT
jgi:hypothetical protein